MGCYTYLAVVDTKGDPPQEYTVELKMPDTESPDATIKGWGVPTTLLFGNERDGTVSAVERFDPHDDYCTTYNYDVEKLRQNRVMAAGAYARSHDEMPDAQMKIDAFIGLADRLQRQFGRRAVIRVSM